jgi:hypothetical protein
MRKNSTILRLALVALLLSSAPTLALAYIDPGNGAYMVQALFTMLGAAFFYLRHPLRSLQAFWQKILRRGRSADSLPSQCEPDSMGEAKISSEEP